MTAVYTPARRLLNDPAASDAEFLERQAEECEVWDKFGVAARLRRIAAGLRAASPSPATRDGDG